MGNSFFFNLCSSAKSADKFVRLVATFILLSAGTSPVWSMQIIPDPQLVKIVESLQPSFTGLEGTPTVEYQGKDEVVISYQAEMTRVYSLYKNGQIAGQGYETLGPKKKGFVLRISLERGDVIHAADDKGELRHAPKWTIQWGHLALPDGDGKRIAHYQLFHGDEIKPDFLKRLTAELKAREAKK